MSTVKPPYSIEAEVSILCAMMIDREAAAVAVGSLKPNHFFREAHRRIFSAMSSVFGRFGSIDIVSVAEELKSRSEMDAIGGYTYLASLIDATPTAAQIQAHIDIVRDRAILRGILEAANAAITDATVPDGRSVREILDIVESRFMAVSGDVSSDSSAWVGDLIHETMERVELAQGGMLPKGVQSGFPDLDRLTGGFHPGEVTVVAARPSMGKTAWALNVAANVAVHARIPVAIFSLEMGKESLMTRLVFSESRVPTQAYKDGNLSVEQMKRLGHGGSAVGGAPIFIDDRAATTVLEIKAKARRVKAERGLGLVIVDYLQLIAGTHGEDQSREQEVAGVSRGLKTLARELNVHVIAVSQLSRGVEKRENKRPVLADLRESGSIEQDADNVLFLYRPEYYAEPHEKANLKGKAELSIAKQRNGPTGEVVLYFHDDYTRFDSVEKGAAP